MIAPQLSSPMAGRRGWVATMSVGWRSVLALCLLSCLVRTSLAESPKVYDIDLPAQSVADALNGLSEKTGVPVVFPYDLVKGRRANPVVGHHTLLEALDEMLKNTGLSGGLSDKGVLTISLARSRAPNAGETIVTQDNNPKDINNKTKAGKRTAIAAFFASVAAAFSASAEEAADVSGDQTESVVLVTAQKRQERIQDVPLSITVLNPEDLADNGQNRLVDYFASVPGLSISNAFSGGTEYLTIRGLSTSFSQNPTVATVIDDVPVGSSTQLGFGMLTFPDLDPSDLSRIEVLKGPQGTLYGADSLGGLVKFVTADPSTKAFSGRAEVTGVDVPDGGGGYAVRAAANIPVADTLAFRISGFARHDPGYVDDLTTGQSNVNSVDVYGGHLSALYRPSEEFSLKLNALIQNTNGKGTGYVNSNYLEQFTEGDLKQTGLPLTAEYDTRWQLYTATVNAKVAGLDVVSVTGYNINSLHNGGDLSGSSYIVQNVTQFFPGVLGSSSVNDYRTYKLSQEIRVSSSLRHWLDWTTGAFFTHENSSDSVQRIYAADINTGAVQGLLEAASYSPLTFSEYALFVELTAHFTDRFDVQVGGRQSWSRILYDATYTGPAVENFFGVPSPDVQPTGHASGNAFTYLVTPRFVISPDLQVYARIASGYRIGGPNLTTGQGLAQDVPPDYRPDKTTNYELGVKADAFDHRLRFDAAVYYIDWKDFQLNVQPLNGAVGFTTNAGAAKSDGVELAVEAHPLQGLTLGVQGSYNNAVLTRDLPPEAAAAGAYGLSGDRLPYNIRFSGSFSANQNVRLSNDWVAFVGGAVNYVGARPYEFSTSSTQPRIWFPAYTQFNLHTGAHYQSWLINLYVNNVSNRRGVVGILPSTNIGDTGGYLTTITQPRTLGLSVAKTF
jgi:iron complex outermembrane recepter protein